MEIGRTPNVPTAPLTPSLFCVLLLGVVDPGAFESFDTAKFAPSAGDAPSLVDACQRNTSSNSIPSSAKHFAEVPYVTLE